MDVNGIEHLWAECNIRVCLGARGCAFPQVHVYWEIPLAASALTQFCPLNMGVMLWITSFSCCRMSLLLLLLNVFLKVRAVYFKADSTVSGISQSSACSGGAPRTYTFFTIKFLGLHRIHSQMEWAHPIPFNVIAVWQGVQEPSHNFLSVSPSY